MPRVHHGMHGAYVMSKKLVLEETLYHPFGSSEALLLECQLLVTMSALSIVVLLAFAWLVLVACWLLSFYL